MNADTDQSQHEDAKSLDTSFFETLWPLILDDNQCRVESESVDYFVPRKPFDQMHWHTLLAKVGYSDYEKPHEVLCGKAANQLAESELNAEKAFDEAVESQSAAVLGDYKATGSLAIRRVDMKIQHLCIKQQRRQRLAYKHANRTYPWTMHTPIQELHFGFTPEMRSNFTCPMEREILDCLYYFNSKMILIDASTEICAGDFHRWIKFRPFAQILCIVRCPRVERHLQLLNVFHTLLVEEDAANTWQQELECSIRSGLRRAKELELFVNCADAFIFIFSRYRGICTCDTYKVLRRI